MTQPLEVLIGIQARSNSTRFPGKIYEKIGDRRVLDLVIDKAKSAALHVMRQKNILIRCQVAILHPEGDQKLVNAFSANQCLLIAGPEEDVLARYVTAQRLTDADYVVRITSDCPLILDHIITKHINSAVWQRVDYVENVDEGFRTAADGFDCEILSRRAIEWLKSNAKDAFDREHVTTLLRKRRPTDLSHGHVQFRYDTSHLKLSIDTPEDLEFVREYIHKAEYKKMMALKKCGRGLVFEL